MIILILATKGRYSHHTIRPLFFIFLSHLFDNRKVNYFSVQTLPLLANWHHENDLRVLAVAVPLHKVVVVFEPESFRGTRLANQHEGGEVVSVRLKLDRAAELVDEVIEPCN